MLIKFVNLLYDFLFQTFLFLGFQSIFLIQFGPKEKYIEESIVKYGENMEKIIDKSYG